MTSRNHLFLLSFQKPVMILLSFQKPVMKLNGQFKIYLNICLTHNWVILWSSSESFILPFFIYSIQIQKSLLPAYTGISNLTSIFAALARLMIFESLTAIFAASSRLSHGKILRLDSAMRAFASSTLVPY